MLPRMAYTRAARSGTSSPSSCSRMRRLICSALRGLRTSWAMPAATVSMRERSSVMARIRHIVRCLMALRAEVLRFTRDDGGVDLVDLLLERFVSLSAEEARGLADGEPAVMKRLEDLMLCEGAIADILRKSAWSVRK